MLRRLSLAGVIVVAIASLLSAANAIVNVPKTQAALNDAAVCATPADVHRVG